MHREVGLWVKYVIRRASLHDVEVLEMGSRDWNGSVRGLFYDAARYVGVDAMEGRGVDLVADCADLSPHFGNGTFGVVLCLEVLEHSNRKREILREMNRLLRAGGVGIMTAGAPGRREHEGGTDFYENVDPEWLTRQLLGSVEWGIELGPNEAGGPDIRSWWRR